MTIVNQTLWDAAPESVRESSRSVMVGTPLAKVLLYFPPGHPKYPNEYKITWLGPMPDATTVATNLDDWLPSERR